MKIGNVYKCDKCGKALHRRNTATLSTFFQPLGMVGYGQGNLGARHLCSECKKKFEKAFTKYFPVHNQILKQ